MIKLLTGIVIAMLTATSAWWYWNVRETTAEENITMDHTVSHALLDQSHTFAHAFGRELLKKDEITVNESSASEVTEPERIPSLAISSPLDSGDWLEYKTGHFLIYYQPETERHFRYVRGRVEALGLEIRQKTGWPAPREKTEVVLTSTGEQFFQFTETSPYRATALYGDNQMVLAPTFWNSDFLAAVDSLQGVGIESSYADLLFLHEYAHALHQANEDSTRNNSFDAEDPAGKRLWFNEGLAVYLSDGFDLAQFTAIKQAVELNQLLPFSQMENIFLSELPPEQASLTYGQGYTIFYYLEQTFGQQKIIDWLNDIQTTSIDDALENTFNLDKTQLEANWRSWLLANYLNIPYRTYEVEN